MSDSVGKQQRVGEWGSGGYVGGDAAGQPKREPLFLVHYGTAFMLRAIICRYYDSYIKSKPSLPARCIVIHGHIIIACDCFFHSCVCFVLLLALMLQVEIGMSGGSSNYGDRRVCMNSYMSKYLVIIVIVDVFSLVIAYPG